MGTRGIFGFRCDGVDKLTYNHFDSYPSALGEDMLAVVREQINRDFTLDAMRADVRAIRLVDIDKDTPSADDIEALEPFTNLDVSRRSTSDWYCLMHGLQRNPSGILATRIMSDDSSFVDNSLFCEWGYVVNLDEKVLEVYRGFQKEQHNLGRYAKDVADRGYYPIALFATVPLYELPRKLTDALPNEDDD